MDAIQNRWKNLLHKNEVFYQQPSPPMPRNGWHNRLVTWNSIFLSGYQTIHGSFERSQLLPPHFKLSYTSRRTEDPHPDWLRVYQVTSMRLRSINLPTLVSLLRIVLASPTFKGTGNNDHGAKPGSPDFWTKLIISIGLVLAGGVFAGSVYFIWYSNIVAFNPLGWPLVLWVWMSFIYVSWQPRPTTRRRDAMLRKVCHWIKHVGAI